MTPTIRATIAALVMIISVIASAAPFHEKRFNGSDESWAIVPSNTYASFVKNWPDKDQSVLCAVIKSPADWDAVFGSAAVMNSNRPFAPAADFYSRANLLVVARVHTASSSTTPSFQVKSIKHHTHSTVMRYVYHPPPADQSFSLTDTLMIAIGKQKSKVYFIENGVKVCEK